MKFKSLHLTTNKIYTNDFVEPALCSDYADDWESHYKHIITTLSLLRQFIVLVLCHLT